MLWDNSPIIKSYIINFLMIYFTMILCDILWQYHFLNNALMAYYSMTFLKKINIVYIINNTIIF